MRVDYVIYDRFVTETIGEYKRIYQVGEEVFDGVHEGEKVTQITISKDAEKKMYAHIVFESGSECIQYEPINSYGKIIKKDNGPQPGN